MDAFPACYSAMRRTAGILALTLIARSAAAQGWDMRAAAAYLDARQTWWSAWPTAARDHQTACVSCHTALPYALARPSLRAALRENDPTSSERKLMDDVVKRVLLWRDVEPFYPDQINGLPKTSESRGTEAVLNALVLATRDAAAGRPSDEARVAFDNLWALQFRRGKPAGSWAWLNFHLRALGGGQRRVLRCSTRCSRRRNRARGLRLTGGYSGSHWRVAHVSPSGRGGAERVQSRRAALGRLGAA